MRIHLIAIGGAAMHNLAIALHQKGFAVTGSDDVVYEPSKSRLDKHGLLPTEMGWNENRITSDIDAIILGMHARVDNPELLKAQELGLKIYSYPAYIYEQSKEKIRVVIGGSHGKTTITSMILHVLNFHQKEFDYLVGAQLAGFDTMVKITDSAPIMVIEGDEYLASPIDRRPKFHLYHANIAVISGIAWDHINVFPTFADYVEQFAKFIDTITPNGKLIYCELDEELKQTVVQSTANVVKIPYGIPAHEVKDGVSYLLPQHTALNVFGDHNLMNLNAAKQVCAQLGIDEDGFNAAISSFAGAAKRLELISAVDQTNVYKDFAHSPSKLKATIHAVKAQFTDRKLVAFMELHTFSSLNKEFLKEYKGAMSDADLAIVYIDAKTFEQKKMQPLTEQDIKLAFEDENLLYFDNAAKLEAYLKGLDYQSTNLLMMSSGTYAGLDLPKLAGELKTK
ncbi:UDP-N-acetylmuramate--L-alanine ligase [Pedobacter xixiisoli]|uniref:UDP-N-acetylmuramate: L-alanyl-gamma-D-glutamyl-meso-diaminopimelate ligase n=1 Tax=Pedobacter xixiisoli TaxID=1476464 RepID=A0A285ZNW0_9SPHI|nr:Mur ligase family protein [Pedobacter xixiisoli]SOD11334.1 UDP-N-acetylmuramate: L-alanyl-gamma-D-glutamyl-meso-diaminopimelate ligase [Pedobacter xixiisoli]